MHTRTKIDTGLSLPYRLISLQAGCKRFAFQCDSLGEGQSAEAILRDGIVGRFSVRYESSGISVHFGCDVSIGNVHAFYTALGEAYERIPGPHTVLELRDDGGDRTHLAVRYDRAGRVRVAGRFLNADDGCESGVDFTLEADQSHLAASLVSMRVFFRALENLQGHGNFE